MRYFNLMLLLTGVCAGPGIAQNYPARAVRLIVGVPPGGTSDTSARIMGPKLADLLGQPVVIENRPGANNGIATEFVARAAPDGYTVLWAFSGGIVVNPVLYRDVRYDPVKDLAPIHLLGTFQFLLVVPRAVTANSLKELIAQIKSSKPSEFPYASGGIGSPNHLAGELLNRAAGVSIPHVPYKGGGPAVVSLISGETKLYFAGIGSVREHVRAGTLKPIAVTGPKRAPEVPNVPTMQEAGLSGYEVQAWIGALAPGATPQAIVSRLHRELAKAAAIPQVSAALTREGLELAGGTSEDFAARIKIELAAWGRLIKEADIKPE